MAGNLQAHFARNDLDIGASGTLRGQVGYGGGMINDLDIAYFQWNFDALLFYNPYL